MVTLPETLPVTECLELIDGLRETAVPVGMVLVNKVVDDRFSASERSVLTPLVDAQPLFGADRFRTMARIGESIEHLREHAGVPLQNIPEFVDVGDALITAVAGALLPEGD